MGRSSSRLATAAAIVLGVGVLAVVGRLLPATPSVQPSPTTAVIRVVTAPPASITMPTEGVLVPEVIGQTLAKARGVMRNLGFPSGAHERDPQAPNAVVVAQEPPAGVWVPPDSPVGFRTRSDLWPNGTPRRLQLGHGPSTASYRVLVADPMYHQLTVAVTVPATVKLRVWLVTTLGRRVPVVDTEDESGGCRPVNQQSRCQVTFDALHEEEPGIWAVGLAKRSTRPATIRVTVTF